MAGEILTGGLLIAFTGFGDLYAADSHRNFV